MASFGLAFALVEGKSGGKSGFYYSIGKPILLAKLETLIGFLNVFGLVFFRMGLAVHFVIKFPETL
jgi:hypothetical protein